MDEYGPEPPPQAESQEEELQKSNEKETIQLGQEQNKDKETEEAIVSEGGEKRQQQEENRDGLPKALSFDRRLSIKERLKQMQMMDDNQEEVVFRTFIHISCLVRKYSCVRNWALSYSFV